MFAQQVKQQSRIDTRAQTDGKRKPDVFQRADKGKVHQLRANEREDGDFDRRFDVLPCIETGCQHFNHD